MTVRAHDDPERVTSPERPREEIVAEAIREQREIEEAHGATPGADPSTRRGFQRTALRTALVAAVIGGLALFVLGALAVMLTDASWFLAVSVAVVGAVAAGLIGALVAGGREDGKVERTVERQTGQRPGPPARPAPPG